MMLRSMTGFSGAWNHLLVVKRFAPRFSSGTRAPIAARDRPAGRKVETPPLFDWTDQSVGTRRPL